MECGEWRNGMALTSSNACSAAVPAAGSPGVPARSFDPCGGTPPEPAGGDACATRIRDFVPLMRSAGHCSARALVDRKCRAMLGAPKRALAGDRRIHDANRHGSPPNDQPRSPRRRRSSGRACRSRSVRSPQGPTGFRRHSHCRSRFSPGHARSCCRPAGRRRRSQSRRR